MSEKADHWTVFIVSIASSLGGLFYYVVVSPSPEKAGRGGVLGLAITLGFLFVSRDYGSRFFKTLTDTLPNIRVAIREMKETPSTQTIERPEPTVKELEHRIKLLAQSIDIDRQGHDTENKFLAAATVIATLVSGFGDVIAKRLIEFVK